MGYAERVAASVPKARSDDHFDDVDDCAFSHGATGVIMNGPSSDQPQSRHLRFTLALALAGSACLPNVPTWSADDVAVIDAAPHDNPFIHAVGTQLFDGNNRRVHLRGVNLGGWLSWDGRGLVSRR